VSVSVVSEVSEGLMNIQGSNIEQADSTRQNFTTEIREVYGQVGELNQLVREMRRDVGVLAGRKSMLTEMYEDLLDRKRAEADRRTRRSLRLRRMRSLSIVMVGGVLLGVAAYGIAIAIQDALG
jgi:hypothetical protein